MNDWQLLECYKTKQSESAFNTLVERHLNMVYMTCLRDIDDTCLAEDATQVVFLILAKKAPFLKRNGSLSGWLFRTARYVSANIRMRENRRRSREIAMSSELHYPDNETVWDDLKPILNDAIQSLRPIEQSVLLMRFFEGLSMQEIGSELAMTDDAVQKRIHRVIMKLRNWFQKHGLTITAVSLVGALSTQSASATPLISAQITPLIASLQGVSALSTTGKIGAITEGVLRDMMVIKMKVAVASAIAIAVTATAAPYAARAYNGSVRTKTINSKTKSTSQVKQVNQTTSTICATNLKELTLGVLYYADAHNGKLPKASTWADDIKPYVNNISAKLYCNGSANGIQWSYAINKDIAGMKVNDILTPTNTVLFFESDKNVKNASGSLKDLVKTPRHNDSYSYAFMDGHVVLSNKRENPDFIWKPFATK